MVHIAALVTRCFITIKMAGVYFESIPHTFAVNTHWSKSAAENSPQEMQYLLEQPLLKATVCIWATCTILEKNVDLYSFAFTIQIKPGKLCSV